MAKNVITIPATKSRYTAAPLSSKKKRRVAAYARVSTDHEDQQSSYEAQVDYYTRYIKSCDDWEFVSIYTDEGISATNTKKREGFKTMIRKPESEWISHEGAHEAIIGPELWEAVQKINQAAKQISANNTPPQASLFTGKLVCADCGHPLVAARETQRRKNGTVKHYTSYFCSRFATTGHSICSWHRIFEISLKNLVLSEIRAHGKAVAADEAAVLDKLKQHIQSASAAQQEDSRQEISRLRRRLEELEQITAKLYEDKVRGAISGDSFSVLIQKNEQERIQKSEHLDSLLAGERKAQQDIANIHQWAGTIRQ